MDSDPNELARHAADLYRAERHIDALAVALSVAESCQAPPWIFSMIGTIYIQGRGGASPNHQEAMRWYRRAADAGDPGALTFLARFALRSGRYDDAKVMLDEAASEGHGRALLVLGYLYDRGLDRGLGVPRDRKRARKYFEEAAADGYIFGKRFIAVQLLRGDEGVLAIPRGAVMFARAVFQAVRGRLQDRYSDKVYW